MTDEEIKEAFAVIRQWFERPGYFGSEHAHLNKLEAEMKRLRDEVVRLEKESEMLSGLRFEDDECPDL